MMTIPIRTFTPAQRVAALDGKMLYYARTDEPPQVTAEHFARLFGHAAPEVIVVGAWNYVPLRAATKGNA